MADKLKATGEQAKKIGNKKKLTPDEYREIAGLAARGGEQADAQAPTTEEVVEAIQQVNKSKRKSPQKPRKRSNSKLQITEEQAKALGIGGAKTSITADDYRKAMGLQPRDSKNVPQLDLSNAGMLGIAFKKGEQKISLDTVFQRQQTAGTMAASASFKQFPKSTGFATAGSWVNNYNLGTLSPPEPAAQPFAPTSQNPTPFAEGPRSERSIGRSASQHLARIAANTNGLSRTMGLMNGTVGRLLSYTGKMFGIINEDWKDRKERKKNNGWGGTMALGAITAGLTGLINQDDPSNSFGALFRTLIPEEARNKLNETLGGKDNVKKYGTIARNITGGLTGLSALGINPMGLLGSAVGGVTKDAGNMIGGVLGKNPLQTLMGALGLGTIGALGYGAYDVATSENPLDRLYQMFNTAVDVLRKIYNTLAVIANKFAGANLPLIESDEEKEKKRYDALEAQDREEGEILRNPRDKPLPVEEGSTARMLKDFGMTGKGVGIDLDKTADEIGGIYEFMRNWPTKWDNMARRAPEQINEWFKKGITPAPDDPNAMKPEYREQLLRPSTDPRSIGEKVSEGVGNAMNYVTSKNYDKDEGLLADAARQVKKLERAKDDDPSQAMSEAMKRNLRRMRRTEPGKAQGGTTIINNKQGDTIIQNAPSPAPQAGGGQVGPTAGSAGAPIDPLVFKSTGMAIDMLGP